MTHSSAMKLPIWPSVDDEERGWRAQVRDAVRDVAQLASSIRLTEQERVGAQRAEHAGMPISITPYYLSLVDPDDPDCPIRKQCVPTSDEQIEVLGDLRDPLGEEAHEVAPHLVQRYPDRVLLLATDRCSVYCRFCTRSRMVGDGGGARSMQALGEAFAWLETNPHVREVIVSGGDPLVMSTDRITRLLDRLQSIPSVDVIRLATRAPVTLPQRITASLAEALSHYPGLWLMTHFNHPKELTPVATEAIRRLVRAGIPVMNQTVLMRGINNDSATLESLFRGLIRHKAKPYYLLQADLVRGTAHLRTPLAEGLALMESLQGRLSGIALPRFIVDTPGGMGKVPLLPNYIVGTGNGYTVLRTYRNVEVRYDDPP